MITRAGLYTFIYGTRINDADPPPLLRLRSSSSFIIATIVIAVFTVRIMRNSLRYWPVPYVNNIGYLPLLGYSTRSSIRVDRQGTRP